MWLVHYNFDSPGSAVNVKLTVVVSIQVTPIAAHLNTTHSLASLLSVNVYLLCCSLRIYLSDHYIRNWGKWNCRNMTRQPTFRMYHHATIARTRSRRSHN